jgi:type IV secretion system protein VirB11
MPESFYQSTPYYRELIKEHLQNHIKAGHCDRLPQAKACLNYLKEQGYEISREDESHLEEWFNHLCHFAKIHHHLKECQAKDSKGAVEEIIVHNNSWVQVIGPERLEFFGPALNKEDFEFSLLLFAQRHGLLWNQASPFLCFQSKLFDQDWRITLIHKSLCDHISSKIFFRHHAKEEFSLESFGLTQGQQVLIQRCLDQKKNILVCGATGSGKTTFLKSLVTLIPEREHLITLEDTPELRPKSPFATQLITPNDKPQGLKEFCHYALRMRPDRMILGEIRSAEVVPFLLSINTGHGGMMSSLHANSALDALHRLCLLFQVYSQQMNVSYHDVMKLVCQGIDFIIFLEHKRVTSIVEVKGCEGTTPYYEMWN